MLFIHVGTMNKAKVRAVREVVNAYAARLNNLLGCKDQESSVYPHDVKSDVPGLPRGFDDTILGARNRANNAASGAGTEEGVHIGVGIESGFIQFPRLGGAIFNFDVCCVKTPDLETYGFSNGTEYPMVPIQHVLTDGADFKQELPRHLGISQPEEERGILGVLTDNAYPRHIVSEIAVRHAFLRLIHNDDFYKP